MTTKEKIQRLKSITNASEFGKDEGYQLLLSILEELEERNG